MTLLPPYPVDWGWRKAFEGELAPVGWEDIDPNWEDRGVDPLPLPEREPNCERNSLFLSELVD